MRLVPPALSLTSWTLYLVLAALWTFYGLVRRTPAIWIGNGRATITEIPGGRFDPAAPSGADRRG
ncbi:MAG: hypothetical protein JKP98_00795 [Rhodobacteraceae bacterium]|nr:hypothetical protein [Paracoccaceae bacterium]